MDKNKNKVVTGRDPSLLILILIIILAFLLRYYKSDSMCLYVDDAYSYWLSLRNFGEILNQLYKYDLHPPLFYFLFHFWTKFGGNPLFLRLPGILLGSLSIAGVYLLGRELINKQAGLFAALLMAFSASHIYLCKEIRMYVYLSFFVIFAFYFFVKLFSRGGVTPPLQSRVESRESENTRSASLPPYPSTARATARVAPTPIYWIAYTVFMIAAWYLNYCAIFVSLSQNIIAVLYGGGGYPKSRDIKGQAPGNPTGSGIAKIAKPRRFGRDLILYIRGVRQILRVPDPMHRRVFQKPDPFLDSPRRRINMKYWIFSQIVILICYLPWYKYLYHQLFNNFGFSDLPLGSFYYLFLNLPLYNFMSPYVLIQNKIVLGAVFIGIVSVFFLSIYNSRENKFFLSVAFIGFFTQLAVMILKSVYSGKVAFHYRYFYYLLPLFFLIIASSFVNKEKIRIFLMSVILACFLIFNLTAIYNMYNVKGYTPRWQEACGYVEKYYKNNDGFIIQYGAQAFAFNYYFRQKHKEYYAAANTLNELPGIAKKHHRIWLIMSYAWIVDPQGGVEKWLFKNYKFERGVELENFLESSQDIIVMLFSK